MRISVLLIAFGLFSGFAAGSAPSLPASAAGKADLPSSCGDLCRRPVSAHAGPALCPSPVSVQPASRLCKAGEMAEAQPLPEED